MTNKILSTVGMLTGVAGALLIALNVGMFFQGYVLFFISAVAWVAYAVRTTQKNLMMLNTVFAVINAIGLYNFS